MPACSVFRISEGLIAEVRSYFDPRPILQRDEVTPQSEEMELGDQGLRRVKTAHSNNL